jgi:hypothetical protein
MGISKIPYKQINIMTNTQRRLWLLLFIQLIALPLWAEHGKKLAWLRVISQEQDTVTGQVDIHLNLKLYDSANVVRGVSAKLPSASLL